MRKRLGTFDGTRYRASQRASPSHRACARILRLNDPASALNTYAGLQIPWEKVAARDKAVYVAVLGANGREEEARKMAASAHDQRPFPGGT